MKTYSAFEYLCIDIANQWGLDKEHFDNRIQWVLDNITDLELLGYTRPTPWKEHPLYLKAVMALRDVQAGRPTGHMVGLDSTASGMQIMSAATGCHSGARITNLVNPDVRYDAYQEIFEDMRKTLPTLPDTEHKNVKQSCMTVLYGSRAEPEKLFGKGTPELNTFYTSMQRKAPGAVQLLDVLLQSWNAFTKKHSWVLPDNFHVQVKVMKKETARIRIAELGHASFNYDFWENTGTKHGLSNVANVVHSLDAYVLRTLVRRCSYDNTTIAMLGINVHHELTYRKIHGFGPSTHTAPTAVQVVIERYASTKFVDISYVNLLTSAHLQFLTTEHLTRLSVLCEQMLSYKPFDILTVHDEFKCHPNHMNQLRHHYREILAELAESEVLSDITSQLYGRPLTYNKLSNNLGQVIRGSAYAIC